MNSSSFALFTLLSDAYHLIEAARKDDCADHKDLMLDMALFKLTQLKEALLIQEKNVPLGKLDATETSGHGDRPILVVDDVDTNRLVLCSMLKQLGFTTELSEGGKEATDLIARKSYGAVFLDLCMPEVDGIEVLKELRDSHLNAATPVIIVTAALDESNTSECRKQGANYLIAKPVMKADVLAALASVGIIPHQGGGAPG